MGGIWKSENYEIRKIENFAGGIFLPGGGNLRRKTAFCD